MGFLDKLSAGAKRAATEAGKALGKGKAKAAELQLQRRMDEVAKKLGYLDLDVHRGRPTDDKVREQLLDDLAGLEEKLANLRAETAAKAAAPEGKAPLA